MNDWHLSMFLDEQLKNFAQQRDGVGTQQKVLALFICPRPFRQQVLQVQGGPKPFCFAIFGHSNRFGAGFASIQTHLQQLVHPAAIGEGNGGKGRSVQAAPVELFRSKDQFAWLHTETNTGQPKSFFSRRGQQAWAAATEALTGSHLACIGKTTLIHFIGRTMKIELLEKAMFEQIAKPEQIGSRAIKLQKILFCFRSIAAFSYLSISQSSCTETLPMRQGPGTAIPESKLHGDSSASNAHVGDCLCCPIDDGQAFFI